MFTGNDDKNSIVRSELYEPPAAKFIRFYPVTFNSSKALRLEVYGSKQGLSLSTYPIHAVQKTSTALKNAI